MELGNVRKTVLRESSYFNNPLVSDESKRKRLNFLFVKDLLDGVNGMILDHKDRLDNEMVGQVPLWQKILASVFLCVSSLGMLYYVYLFAMNQSSSRQRGWFNSFQVWLFFEIFIISTGLVLVEHVLIPLWSMKEIQRVKEKIVAEILTFQKKLKKKQKSEKEILEESILGSGDCDPRSFNAAEFLYPSHRLAKLFPQYPESQLILQYKTLWPKKSFKRGEKSVKKKYDKRFEFITRTIGRVGIFTVTSVVQLPPSLQDMGIQATLFLVTGYLLKFFIRLFEINPILVIFPFLLLLLLARLFLVSRRRLRNVDPSKTHPLADSDDDGGGAGASVATAAGGGERRDGGKLKREKAMVEGDGDGEEKIDEIIWSDDDESFDFNFDIEEAREKIRCRDAAEENEEKTQQQQEEAGAEEAVMKSSEDDSGSCVLDEVEFESSSDETLGSEVEMFPRDLGKILDERMRERDDISSLEEEQNSLGGISDSSSSVSSS
jgi:hypothetical protein